MKNENRTPAGAVRGIVSLRRGCAIIGIAGLLLEGHESRATIIDPATLPGMALRLDANAITGLNNNDPVATWTDTSGNSQNATQSNAAKQPLFVLGAMPSGKPAVQFDGVDDFLSETVNLSGAQTWFVVYRQNTVPTGNQTLAALSISGVDNQVTLIPSSAGYDNLTLFVNAAAGNLGVGFNPTLDTSGHVLAFTRNAASDAGNTANYTAAYDLTAQTLTAPSGPIGSADGAIGAQNSGSVNFLNGDVAEIIIYNGVLSQANFDGVQQYLEDKWFTVPEPSTGLLLAVGGLVLQRKLRMR